MQSWGFSVSRSLPSVFRPYSQRATPEIETMEEQQAETPLLGINVNSKRSRACVNIQQYLDDFTRPRVSGSSTVVSILLVLCSCITSTTLGYDASMMNGLNMLPSYTEYFQLSTATTSLATSALWIGGAIAGLTYGQITDAIGRRNSMFWAAMMTLISVVVQSGAQNIATFVVGRILVGYGTSASTLTGPTYLAETLPYQWRAWGIGLLNDCYYVGGLIAAGITYKTATLDSTLVSFFLRFFHPPELIVFRLGASQVLFRASSVYCVSSYCPSFQSHLDGWRMWEDEKRHSQSLPRLTPMVMKQMLLFWRNTSK